MNKINDIAIAENIIENWESVSYSDFNKSKSLFNILTHKGIKNNIEITDQTRIKNLKEFIDKKVYKVIYLNIINNKFLSNEEEKILQEKYPNIYIWYSHSWNQDFNYLLLLTNKGIRIPVMLWGLKIDIGFGSGNLDQYIVWWEKGSKGNGNLDFIKDFIEQYWNNPKINNKLEKKEITLSDLIRVV